MVPPGPSTSYFTPRYQTLCPQSSRAHPPHHFDPFTPEPDDLVVEIGAGTSVVGVEADLFSEFHVVVGARHPVFFVEPLYKDSPVDGPRDGSGNSAAGAAAHEAWFCVGPRKKTRGAAGRGEGAGTGRPGAAPPLPPGKFFGPPVEGE